MGRSEQKEEREVLDSIFPEEITDVSEEEFRVSIALDIPFDGHGDGEAPTIILRVRYPEQYPEEQPDLDLSNPHNAPKYKHLDLHEDKARLLESLKPTIEENLGMAMVFTLVSTLKDNVESLISERLGAEQVAKDQEAAKAEEEENKKFHGSAVTRKSFLEWQAKFKIEVEVLERKQQEEREAEDRKKRIPREEKKMTGRELWERGLAGKLEEEDEDVDTATQDITKTKLEE